MQGRGHSSGNWIRVAMPVALLAMACLLLVMSGHPTGVDERTRPPEVVETARLAVAGGGGVGVGAGAGGVGVGVGDGDGDGDGDGTLCVLAPPPQATSAIRVLMVIMARARFPTLFMLII